MERVLTSEQQMNVFRLRDKMSLLNADFIKVINGYYQEKAHYDFTGTMESYIDHVKKLRKMYSAEPETAATAEEPTPSEKPKTAAPAVISTRKMAKAHRRNGSKTEEKPAPTSSDFAASSPAVKATAPTFGNISIIGNETPAPIAKKSAEIAEKAEIAAPVPAAARKRAIRGGGPLGGSESVVFKSGTGENEKSTSTSQTTIPEVTIKFPEPSKDFWTKKPDAANSGSIFAMFGKGSSETTPAPKFTGFSFGKKDETEKKESEKPEAPKTSESPVKPLAFGVKPSEATTTSPEAAKAFSLASSLFKTNTSSDAKLSFGSTLTSSTTTSDASAPKLSFGSSLTSSTTSSEAPKLSFGSSLTSSTNSDASASKLSFGSSTTTSDAPAPKFSFGSSLTSSTTTSAAPSLFSGFAGLAQKAMANQNQEKKDDDEEAEYVPPKAETVENEEPDAILSSKVSVFKFTGKEYSKLGVGMLHIKNTDDKHSLLIRAATTTGTVWLNALCNKAMKATKVDEKGERIRLTCPTSASEMTTMMIRFGTADGAKKFTEKIDELSK